MRLKIFAVLIAGIVLAGTSSNAEEMSYPVFRLQQEPVMDGKWEDKAWNMVPAGTGFISFKTGGYSTSRQTSFKMGWHGSDLYLAVKCDEPEPDTIKTDANNYRDGWYPDDNIEFFTSRDKSSKGYHQFVTNSRGGRWCNFSKLTTKAGETWQSVSHKGQDFWSVEVKIPFELLGLGKDLKGKQFWFNLGRAAHKNPKNDIYTSFANVKNGFADVSNFTALTFENSLPASSLKLARIKKDLDRYQNWLRKKLWRIAYIQEIFLQKHLGSGSADEKVRELVGLKQEAKKIFTSKNLSGMHAVIREYDKLAAELNVQIKKIALTMQTRGVRAKLYLNGRELLPGSDGKYMANIKEGFSVLAAECVSSGDDPAIQAGIDGLPETFGRWKISRQAGGDWMKNGFNDRDWAVPSLTSDKFLWSKESSADKVYMRQIILWSPDPFGELASINPPVREWLFSEDTVEQFFLALYSPLPGKTQDYEFILEAPEAFKLLDMKNEQPFGSRGSSHIMNAVPETIIRETVLRHGHKYNRFRLKYKSKDIPPAGKVFHSILPVKLAKWDSSEKKTRFYFRRLAGGNFTELENVLPVRILPPVNGGAMKKITLTQYVGMPYFAAHISYEHLEEVIKQSIRAGFNSWTIKPRENKFYKKLYALLTAEKNMHLWVWPRRNYPIWGSWDVKGALFELLEEKPEFQARYFNDSSDWRKRGMYCPTYATGKGRDLFKEAVKKDFMKFWISRVPEVEFIMDDWECQPWIESHGIYISAETGNGSYCFCDRCKKAFKKSINMPESQELTDTVIFKEYYGQWNDFRHKMDGNIQGIMRDSVAEFGRKYIVYSWTVQRKFWEACRGNIDYAFPGCPGNAVADSRQQEFFDTTMEFFRTKLGLDRVHGQRFSFFGPYKINARKYNVMSSDGYVDPQSWKPQILRIVASLHSGVDMQSSLECVSGMLYYIGEATRIIAEYEGLFYEGKREDSLASSEQIKYPDLLVLTNRGQRLVLLFNEDQKPLEVILHNKNLKRRQSASIWETPGRIKNPAIMKLTVPPNDAVAVHIKQPSVYRKR